MSTNPEQTQKNEKVWAMVTKGHERGWLVEVIGRDGEYYECCPGGAPGAVYRFKRDELRRLK